MNFARVCMLLCWAHVLECAAFSRQPTNQLHQLSFRNLAAIVGQQPPRQRQNGSMTVLFMSDSDNNDKKKKKGGLDENVRTRLLTESIAPWRTVRLFLYFSAGSGALLGGLITLSGALAALSGARSDLDMNTQYMNLAIDFGAVLAFALLAKFDLDKQSELEEGVQEKIERKKQQKTAIKAMRDREQLLGTLLLKIKVSADETRNANIKQLQAGAKQHMILVAGPRKACKDALIGANLLKMDFAMSNVLVVPYETDTDLVEEQSKPSGTGFGDTRPIYETQPYVARPVGDGWESYIEEELAAAVEQSGEKAREEGIAIVVANNGKVLRRGVGKVPWRQMMEELQATVKA